MAGLTVQCDVHETCSTVLGDPLLSDGMYLSKSLKNKNVAVSLRLHITTLYLTFTF